MSLDKISTVSAFHDLDLIFKVTWALSCENVTFYSLLAGELKLYQFGQTISNRDMYGALGYSV